MSHAEYHADLFSKATGWLGWSPQVALTTPIPQIILALEGKMDFAVMSNPFGGGKPQAEPEAKPDLKKAANDAKAAFSQWR